MDALNERLKKLGEAVSDTAERRIDAGELPAARRRWIEARVAAGGALAPPARRGRALLLAAACLAVLLASLTLLRPRGRVSFVVGSPPARGAVGEWVAAGPGAALPVQFSEGTSFLLAPGARARVAETTAHGATLLLESGRVSAAVKHTGDATRWGLHAGPFQVAVTGTRFDASWDPSGETFTLVMDEGTVVVRGPLLEAGRELHAGERLQISLRDGALILRTTLASSEVAAEAAPPVPPSSTESPVSTPPTPTSTSAPATTGPAPARPPVTTGAAASSERERDPRWRDLAAAGKFNEALAAAVRAGFAGEIERASSRDLAVLVDAARYGGRPDLARQALLAQRRRFGARGASAFMLGKIAADQQGGGDAARWFQTYLSEEPRGAFAEQALGRLLELQKGNPAAARATAERYLAQYPSGAHAALARSMVAP